ncbi:MAG: PEP-CTERM sorting domain-containing protein [Oxalobacteraceae bacterium]
MNIFKTGLLTTFTALSLTCAGIASATIIFETGNNPQADEQNILFNGPGTISGPALTVTGRTNQTDTVVAFTSSENLVTPASGQARVEGADGAFQDLSVYLQAGGTFSDLIFNLNTPNAEDGNALITVHQLVGADATYNLALGNGQNFLTILAIDGQRITSVDINSGIGVNMVNIDDGRQFRISGIQGPTTVPEPAAVWLLGIGLLGMAGMRRKGKRQVRN